MALVRNASCDNLKITQAELKIRVTERDSATNPLKQAEADVKEAETNVQRINDLIAQQGAAPADREIKFPVKSTCRNKRGKKYSCTKTITKYEKREWKGQQFADQLPAAIAKRDESVDSRTQPLQGGGIKVGNAAGRRRDHCHERLFRGAISTQRVGCPPGHSHIRLAWSVVIDINCLMDAHAGRRIHR